MFHFGTSLAQYSIESTTRRIDGAGGKMNSFWAMNSLRMSFWSVPPSFAAGTPCFSATAMYMHSRIAAGELMVMEVVMSASGMPSKSVSMSARESMATPQCPISPRLVGASESWPIKVGMSNATERPVWPFASKYLYRRLVSSAVANPENWRIVHRRPR